MFYFLVFHTKISSSNDIEKKLITTLVYGTVLYVLFHVLLSTSQKPFFITMRQYFWIMLLVDIIAVMAICRSLITKMTDQTKGSLSGVGKRMVSFLEDMIDTGIYSDTIDFDNQSDDVITDLEAVKRRAGILKQKHQKQQNKQQMQNGNKVSFDSNGNTVEYIDPEDEGGMPVSMDELQQVNELIKTLTTETEKYQELQQKQPHTRKPGSLGSTPISDLQNLHQSPPNNQLKEGELPPELQPIYTVPKNSENGQNGRRILRNPLQSDLQPGSDAPLPPPECVASDNDVSEAIKRATTYNPNVWDDPSPYADMPSKRTNNNTGNNTGNTTGNNTRNNTGNNTGNNFNMSNNNKSGIPPAPDFSKPLPANSVYNGNAAQLSSIKNITQSSENNNYNNSDYRNDDSRSEVSEFDVDLSDFEDSL